MQSMIHRLVLRQHFLAENWKAINIHRQNDFLLFYIREKQCQGTDFPQNYAARQWESRKQYPSCLCSYQCLSAWPVPCSTRWHFWESSLKSRKRQMKNQVLPVAFLLIWRLSSTLNKFKDGQREKRTARMSAWKQQRLKRDQWQPVHNLSSHYFFTPLLILEKPGPMNILKMSRSNIISKENKLTLYFSFSTLHQHLPKHCVPCSPGASAGPGAAPGMTGSLAGDKWKLMLIISCPLNTRSATVPQGLFFYFFSS